MTLVPADEGALAEAIRTTPAPLEIRGGGTRSGLGRPVQAGETLSTAGLTGFPLYDPGALTLVVRAGTPLAEVEARLEAEGQMLPFEPMDHRALLGTTGAPTIGAVAACNISGPRRIQAGAARDFLIGIRMVDGEGRVIKNGGRVMKNVTGYDLVKLVAGSYGTLGVLTELAFKVLPRPERRATLVIAGLGDAAAIDALSAALGTPYEVNGAAHLPGEGRTYLRIEGFAEQVGYRAERLADHLGRLGVQAGLHDGADPWPAIRDVTWAAHLPGAVWRFSVPPSHGATLGAALRAGGAEALGYDWGGGLVWAVAPEGVDLRATWSGPGHGTLVRASPAMRMAIPPFHPEAAPLAALAAGLRARFDPRGILNPGRMA